MPTTTLNPSFKLELTSSPHIHSRWTTKNAMWMVVYALIPSILSAAIFFGLYQIMIIFVSVLFSVSTEAFIKYIRKREISLSDGSAVITGLLLGLILPPDFSLFGAALGSVVAIGIGKEIFGGLGYNIFNPALVGRAFLQAAYPVFMTTWQVPNFAVDGTTSATPLAAYKFDKVLTSIDSLLYGNIGGSIGETSSVAIIIGGGFLLISGVANWRIPLSMILGAFLFSGALWVINPDLYANPLFHLFAGGFMFGALFMATDWVSSPFTQKGMWIYGFSIGFLIILIRTFGGLPEGVMYAILIMNAIVPLINKYSNPKIFGATK